MLVTPSCFAVYSKEPPVIRFTVISVFPSGDFSVQDSSATMSPTWICTEAVFVTLPKVASAVIVTVPFASPLTIPLPSTVATSSSLLVYVTESKSVISPPL